MGEIKRSRGFLIPLRLVTKAAKEGIGIHDFQTMVAKSARITHPEGNRRYHDFIFQLEGTRVLNFVVFKDTEEEQEEVFHKCEVCKDTGKVIVFDACEHCDGTGCKHCDTGLVKSTIACPECKASTRLDAIWKPRKQHHQR